MERPNIPPNSIERLFLSTANYVFTGVFAVEMLLKVCFQKMFQKIFTSKDKDNYNFSSELRWANLKKLTKRFTGYTFLKKNFF